MNETMRAYAHDGLAFHKNVIDTMVANHELLQKQVVFGLETQRASVESLRTLTQDMGRMVVDMVFPAKAETAAR